MPKITKLTVGRGRTSRPSDQEEWLKEYYEFEVDVSDVTSTEGIEKVRIDLEQHLRSWLSEPMVAGVPKLDMSKIEQLPWKTYKDKMPCTPGEAGWIFTNAEGAEELVKAIKTAPKEKLELPPYQFTFSGKEKQFISRKSSEGSKKTG